jgi:hypothetical protein
MSMEHKAFVFDYHAFQEQLSIVLREALGAGRVSALPEFIKRNIGALRDPNTGERLGVDWESAVVPKDVHQYADVALTKFYDPSRDRGLGYRWEELQEVLARHDLMPSILLGSAFGFARNYFDPGKMGAYFQTPDQAAEHVRRLEALAATAPGDAHEVQDAIVMFQQAVKAQTGLYITF